MEWFVTLGRFGQFEAALTACIWVQWYVSMVSDSPCWCLHLRECRLLNQLWTKWLELQENTSAKVLNPDKWCTGHNLDRRWFLRPKCKVHFLCFLPATKLLQAFKLTWVQSASYQTFKLLILIGALQYQLQILQRPNKTNVGHFFLLQAVKEYSHMQQSCQCRTRVLGMWIVACRAMPSKV